MPILYLGGHQRFDLVNKASRKEPNLPRTREVPRQLSNVEREAAALWGAQVKSLEDGCPVFLARVLRLGLYRRAVNEHRIRAPRLDRLPQELKGFLSAACGDRRDHDLEHPAFGRSTFIRDEPSPRWVYFRRFQSLGPR